MAITAFTGAVIVSGNVSSPTNTEPEAAPSMFYHGTMLLDSRQPFTYWPGQGDSQITYGWYGTGGNNPVIDQVPTVISTNSVAQAQQPTSGTALTLTASNTNNVTINQTITNARNGVQVTGLRAIDGAMGTVAFGSNANLVSWSPATAISRQITITGSSLDNAGSWAIAGFDIYGYPVSETVGGSTTAGITVASQKCYKYIASITPGGTIASTGVIVGVNDVYGIPLRTDNGAYLSVYFNNATTITSSQVTAASTVTATSTTADVRGTFTSSTASDGSRRLLMFWSPKTANMTSATDIFGVTQYSTGTYNTYPY